MGTYTDLAKMQSTTVLSKADDKKQQKNVRKSVRHTERPNQTVEPFDRTERPIRTVNQELTPRGTLIKGLKKGAITTINRRPTVRYSFEIYVDQKNEIEELQYQYKRKTGKKISASRIIREALSEYFIKAKSAIEDD